MTTPSGDAGDDFTVTPGDVSSAAGSADKTAAHSAEEISELMEDYGISPGPREVAGGPGAGAGGKESVPGRPRDVTGRLGAGAGGKGSGPGRRPREVAGGPGAGGDGKASRSGRPREAAGRLSAALRSKRRGSPMRRRTVRVGATAAGAVAVVVAGSYAAVGAVLASPHPQSPRVSAADAAAKATSSPVRYSPVKLGPVPHVPSPRPTTSRVPPRRSHPHRKTRHRHRHAAAPPAPPPAAPPVQVPASPAQTSSPVHRTRRVRTPPPPQPFNISGAVTCTSGHAVVGVWVAAAQGAGYSPWRGQGNGETATYWYTLPKKESWSLHVGCGGSPSSWGVATYSVTVSSANVNFACDDVQGQAGYGTCRVN